jgi:hypothetical protein
VAAANCPMYPAYFDPQARIWHDKPVSHGGIQASIQDYPAECLWAQLQWEREQADGGAGASSGYLANLEAEWSRRDLCSRCLRDLDHPFMTEVDALRHSKRVAQGKLTRIRGALSLLSESELRKTLNAILDESGD